MEKIKLITDSGSDIPLGVERAHECLTVMNFKVSLGELDFVSRVEMTNDEFYEELAKTEALPKTAQLTIFEFVDVLETAYNEGYTHVLVTLINKEASATFGNCIEATKRFFDEHPDAKDKFTIRVIDSRSYTGGYGYPVRTAIDMVEQGKSFDEICDYVQDVIDHLVIYFVPYSLKYARKSGRIPGAVAVVGEAMGIKPIMRIYDHKIVNDEMVRGEKKLLGKLSDKVLSEIETGAPYNIVYGNNPDDCNALTQMMTEKLGYPPVDSYQINPIVTSHAGPKVIGVIFRSTKAEASH